MIWDGEPKAPSGTPPEEEDRLWEAWDRELDAHYWNPAIMNGAIPICDRGCALRRWLVINGDQKGFVWNDDRADNGGIAPVLGGSRIPQRFTDWYTEWLNNSLRELEKTTCSTVVASLLRTWQRFSRRSSYSQSGIKSPFS